jgi:hypothetical protein
MAALQAEQARLKAGVGPNGIFECPKLSETANAHKGSALATMAGKNPWCNVHRQRIGGQSSQSSQASVQRCPWWSFGRLCPRCRIRQQDTCPCTPSRWVRPPPLDCLLGSCTRRTIADAPSVLRQLMVMVIWLGRVRIVYKENHRRRTFHVWTQFTVATGKRSERPRGMPLVIRM